MNNFQRQLQKHRLAAIIGGVVLVVASLLAALAFSVASIKQSASDGLSDYQGEYQQAARNALNETNEFYSSGNESISSIVVAKRKVVSVTKVVNPSKGVYSNCKVLYSVGIVEIYIFGSQSEPQDKLTCLSY